MHIIIACDEQDSELGSYFAQSNQYLNDFLIEKDFTVKNISSPDCHQAHIDFFLGCIPKPLVFISYSHGNSNSLRCNGTAYLATDNVAPLHTSFIYAMSCSAATGLGATFMGQEGVFIGFDKEVWAFKSGQYLSKCIECDNSGIIFAFSHPDSTLKDAYKAMKKYYTNIIDKLYDMKVQALYIGYFINMRNSLKIIGNENLTIKEIFTAK